MNPKSVSLGELYGYVDPIDFNWKHGLASNIMNIYANDDSFHYKWCVYDGPVDAVWIENMNTVLDDNMMLCLANGKRIMLKPQMAMLFEVEDLEEASPATVSRCGIVYLSYPDLGWRPVVKTWMTKYFTKQDEIKGEQLLT